MPDWGTGQSVQCKDLIWTCDIEHAISRERCYFETEVLNREDPFQLERCDIGADLICFSELYRLAESLPL